MRKKITLLLLALVSLLPEAFADSPFRVFYLNNTQPFTTSSWTSFQIGDLKSGDVLRVCGSGTIRLAYNTTSEGGWTEKNDLPSLETDGVNITLTDAEVGYINNYGLFVSIVEGANVTSIGYGTPNCSSNSLIDSDQTADLLLDQSVVTSCNIGDEIVFVFKATETTTKSEFKFAISDTETQNWDAISGAEWQTFTDMSSTPTVTVKVTSLNVERLQSGKCKLRSDNTTYTSITVNSYTYTYTYLLSSSNNNVDISALSAKGTVNVEFTRASYDNYYNTLCLPFDWVVSETFPGADVYTYSNYDSSNNTIGFSCVGQSGTVSAGTPCFINFGGSAPENTMTKSNVTIVESPNTTAAYKGNFIAGATPTGTYYGLAYNSTESATKFYKAGSGASLKAFSAYFVASEATNARGFSINLGDGTTFINDLDVENNEGDLFNLNGIRIDSPQKGIYVKGGKKYLVK